MSRVLQLSDLHVRARHNARENRRLRRVVRWIRQKHGDRPHVILSGDITHNGAEREYANALEILRPLREDGFPIVSCPGNHDVGPLGNSFSVAARVYFQQYILGQLMGIPAAAEPNDILDRYYPMVTPLGDATLIGLDSAHREDYLASGRLGAAQLARLDVALNEVAPGNQVLVYVHHHPFMRGRSMRMRDGDQLLAAIAGRVELLCFGHRHEWDQLSGEHQVPIICASGKTTKPVPRKGLRYYEFKLGEGGPRYRWRVIPTRWK